MHAARQRCSNADKPRKRNLTLSRTGKCLDKYSLPVSTLKEQKMCYRLQCTVLPDMAFGAQGSAERAAKIVLAFNRLRTFAWKLSVKKEAIQVARKNYHRPFRKRCHACEAELDLV